MPTYGRADLAFERGEGAWLYTDDGRKFLDFGSGIAVTSLGHAHPHLVAALHKQADALWHTSNLYRIPEQERLAERLAANSFAERVFFCNSGAEAVEAGMKLVRKYQSETGHPERYRMLVFSDSFHGRTMSTIAAGASDAHRAGFGPAPEGFDRVPVGNMNEVRAAITPETAGILIEPVQGEGGILPVDPQFLRDLREAADEYGLLLMFDEVQCGVGRTGKLFGYEHSGVAPDVMALAKGLGGGFPIGACLATEKAAVGMVPGTHGSTFGGNPLATAVANAVLDVMLDGGFFDQVAAASARLKIGLDKVAAAHPDIIDGIRGVGMMWGIRCKVPNADLYGKILDREMLTVLAGDNVVRFLPALTVTDADIDHALDVLDAACGDLES